MAVQLDPVPREQEVRAPELQAQDLKGAQPRVAVTG